MILPLHWSSVIHKTLSREQRIREGLWLFDTNTDTKDFPSTLFPCQQMIISCSVFSSVLPFNRLPAPTSCSINYHCVLVKDTRLQGPVSCLHVTEERGTVSMHVTRHWLGILLVFAPINVSTVKMQSLRYPS